MSTDPLDSVLLSAELARMTGTGATSRDLTDLVLDLAAAEVDRLADQSGNLDNPAFGIRVVLEPDLRARADELRGRRGGQLTVTVLHLVANEVGLLADRSSLFAGAGLRVRAVAEPIMRERAEELRLRRLGRGRR